MLHVHMVWSATPECPRNDSSVIRVAHTCSTAYSTHLGQLWYQLAISKQVHNDGSSTTRHSSSSIQRITHMHILHNITQLVGC